MKIGIADRFLFSIYRLFFEERTRWCLRGFYRKSFPLIN